MSFIGASKTYRKDLETFKFVANSYAQNTNSLTVPSTAQAGDFVIIGDNIWNGLVSGSLTAPSGWTLIRSDGLAFNVVGACYYKILEASDVGSTVTSVDTSTTDHFMLCSVFRPNAGTITGVTINDSDGEASTGDPASQTLSMSSATSTPLIGFFMFYQRAVNTHIKPITLPSNFAVSMSVDELGFEILHHQFIIYEKGATPVDATADIVDNGAQVAQSFYLTFSSTPTYESSVFSLNDVSNSVRA